MKQAGKNKKEKCATAERSFVSFAAFIILSIDPLKVISIAIFKAKMALPICMAVEKCSFGAYQIYYMT